METAAASHLVPVLKAYQFDYPDVHLRLITGETHGLLQKVKAGELDGAFVYGPLNEPHIEYLPVFEEELVLISEPGRNNVSELLTKPMLFFDVGCTHRVKAEHFLRENGVTSYQIREFGTLEVILNGVTAGLGVSLLPQSSIAKADKEGRISTHRLPEGYRELQVGFIYQSGQVYSSALSSLLEGLDCEIEAEL
nr:LysR substrate-binding domain-containing protein [Paenibacillus donghaensis]